jgi:hypothetical protein
MKQLAPGSQGEATPSSRYQERGHRVEYSSFRAEGRYDGEAATKAAIDAIGTGR